MLERILKLVELTSAWELAAVALAIAYVLLAIRKHMACWAAAIASSAIYVALMSESRLYMEAALNVFYVAMAVYGYWEWRRGRAPSGDMVVVRWSAMAHAGALIAIAGLTLVNGALLARYTDAARPYLDSLITWGSVITTWMVARRVIESWLYWIAIDAIAAVLYFQQGRAPTGLLFAFYVVMSVQGFRVWMRSARSCTLGMET